MPTNLYSQNLLYYQTSSTVGVQSRCVQMLDSYSSAIASPWMPFYFGVASSSFSWTREMAGMRGSSYYWGRGICYDFFFMMEQISIFLVLVWDSAWDCWGKGLIYGRCSLNTYSFFLNFMFQSYYSYLKPYPSMVLALSELISERSFYIFSIQFQKYLTFYQRLIEPPLLSVCYFLFYLYCQQYPFVLIIFYFLGVLFERSSKNQCFYSCLKTQVPIQFLSSCVLSRDIQRSFQIFFWFLIFQSISSHFQMLSSWNLAMLFLPLSVWGCSMGASFILSLSPPPWLLALLMVSYSTVYTFLASLLRMSLLWDRMICLVLNLRQALWILLAQAFLRMLLAVQQGLILFFYAYFCYIYLISTMSTSDTWVSTLSLRFLRLYNFYFSQLELLVYFMMLSYSLTACSRIDMFLTIRAWSLPLREGAFLLGEIQMDLALGRRPRAEEMGVGAVCFFREGGYSVESLRVSCWEVLYVVLNQRSWALMSLDFFFWLGEELREACMLLRIRGILILRSTMMPFSQRELLRLERRT